jgi:MerR family transcriptional regulator, light-induced transcriptional regulator
MERYTIRDLDKLSGINAHTIRVWERRYGIIKPQRTGTNRRRYDDADLRKIINISILKRNGFKISEIAGFAESEIEEKVTLLSTEVFNADTHIDSMVKAMVAFDENSVNELINKSLMYKGLEETMTSLVFPFLKRIGVMWQTGSADIGAEHFISNIFRKKLIAAIDNISPSENQKRKKVLLFLPEKEMHEMGLLFFQYLVKKEGHESLYLGQSTPLSAVVTTNRQWKADIIITGILSGYPGFKADEYIKELSASLTGQKVLVAGELATAAVKLKYQNVFPLNSAEDLRSLL